MTFAQAAVVEPDAAKPIQGSQSTAGTESATTPQSRELKIPAGTPLDIEAVYTVSSIDMRPGDLLSFHTLVPVKIDGVTVIDRRNEAGIGAKPASCPG